MVEDSSFCSEVILRVQDSVPKFRAGLTNCEWNYLTYKVFLIQNAACLVLVGGGQECNKAPLSLPLRSSGLMPRNRL